MVTDTCEIQDDVVIVRLAAGDFARLADIVRIASEEEAFTGPMRLLIDLRIPAREITYKDMCSQARALAGLRDVVARQWAILAADSIEAMNAAFTFASLARVENVVARVFIEEAKALLWLQEGKRP